MKRTLGLFSAVNIGVGTMIGAGIFVLAGTSFEIAGPSASLAIFLSGVAAVFTALSFAELVTLLPTSGGGYDYVCEASGHGILGFICGYGFWLGYAISAGLFALGFGKFIHYFVPAIPQLPAALALIAWVVYINACGLRSTGAVQNISTTVLVALLAVFIVYGLFFLKTENLLPFFPGGAGGTLQVTGLLYMTYIGFGLVTHISEEVNNPEKTIPRSIIIAIVAAMLIKAGTFLVGCGVLPRAQLIPAATSTPMLDVALLMGGKAGGILFALAGILAMLTSINTAVLAASRICFAMARDKCLPLQLAVLSKRSEAPLIAVLLTGAIAALAAAVRNFEYISTISSIFSLVGYSLVNMAVIIFRKKRADQVRVFRVPFSPYLPALGIAINLFLAGQLLLAEHVAARATFAAALAGGIYYILAVPALRAGQTQKLRGSTP